MNTTAVTVVSTLLGLALICVIFLAFRYLPNFVRRYVFRWYFNFFPEPEDQKELRKLQLKSCILPSLKNLAKLLNDVYQKETRNLELINRMDHGSANDFEGMRGNLMDIRKDIKQAEREFYRAKYTAQFFGFNVPEDFKDYLK